MSYTKKQAKFKYHSGLECLHCNTQIYSLSTHDFVSCNCKKPDGIFVDGGLDYFRYGFPPKWKEGKDFKVIKQKWEN